MEFVILGFLMMKAFSQYELKKILEKEVSPFYSASLGSIQSALKKLMSKNIITLEKVVENGRQKNIYSINEDGRQQFQKWMIAPINEKKLDAESSTKLFFLGLIEKKQRIVTIKNIIECIEKLLNEYDKVDAKYKKTMLKPNISDAVEYQLKTLELGIYGYECNLEWFRQLLIEMEE